MNMDILQRIPRQIIETVNQSYPGLEKIDPEIISTKRNKQNRTIKEILGHLIDSASNNHQRIVRLQYNKTLTFPDYRQDNDLWIAIENHNSNNWKQLTQTWRYMNYHMAYIISVTDASCLQNTWIDFEDNVVTLQQIIEYYIIHINLHLREIDEIINSGEIESK